MSILNYIKALLVIHVTVVIFVIVLSKLAQEAELAFLTPKQMLVTVFPVKPGTPEKISGMFNCLATNQM